MHTSGSVLLLAIACFCSVFFACSVLERQSAAKHGCEAAEIVEGNLAYNRLVCEGARQMEQRRYAEAAKTFEMAMKIPLFEFPNFALFPRLALAFFKAGDREKAKDALQKAEISLSVLIGKMHCKEEEQDFRLVNQEGVSVAVHGEAISERMCGAAYEYIYTQRSFEIVLSDAKLIALYFEVKQEIEGDR